MYATSIVIENTEITLYFGDELYHVQEILPSFPHMHAVHELFVLLSGEVLFEGAFGQEHIADNDICILPPFTLHATIAHQPSRAMPLLFTYQKISAPCEFDFFACMSKLSARQGEPILCRGNALMVANLFDAVARFRTGDLSVMQEIKIKHVLSLMFISLSERIGASPAQAQRLYDKGREHYRSLVRMDMLLAREAIPGRMFGVDIGALAQKMSFSMRQMQNIFGQEYRMSVKTYVYLLKMEFAAFALRHFPDLTVAQIGALCHYASPGAFSTLFAKYHGLSATEYRKRHRAEDWSGLSIYHQLYDKRQSKEENHERTSPQGALRQ